jgi:hypothetical protein
MISKDMSASRKRCGHPFSTDENRLRHHRARVGIQTVLEMSASWSVLSQGAPQAGEGDGAGRGNVFRPRSRQAKAGGQAGSGTGRNRRGVSRRSQKRAPDESRAIGICAKFTQRFVCRCPYLKWMSRRQRVSVCFCPWLWARPLASVGRRRTRP